MSTNRQVRAAIAQASETTFGSRVRVYPYAAGSMLETVCVFVGMPSAKPSGVLTQGEIREEWPIALVGPRPGSNDEATLSLLDDLYPLTINNLQDALDDQDPAPWHEVAVERVDYSAIKTPAGERPGWVATISVLRTTESETP